jgi:crotonobetainyl-CoA:carnitine CoA-transferase CaiB-like acyl-CoA transferase
MFFAAPVEERAALARTPDLTDLAEIPYEDLHEALAMRFKSKPLAEWRVAFAEGQSTVVPLASLHQTRDSSLQRESAGNIDISQSTFRVIRHDQHPMGRWCDLVAPNAVRPASGQITIPGPMPKYGAQTRQILGRLGYAENAIDKMLADGIASESWSEKYLPE